MGGASNYNGVGVKNYGSAQQGTHATVTTLTNGHYGNIVGLLRSGKATPQQLATAVSHSPWGTGSGVLRVLGSGPVRVPDVSSASPTPAGLDKVAGGLGINTKGLVTDMLFSSAQALAAGQHPDLSTLLSVSVAKNQLGAHAQELAAAGHGGDAGVVATAEKALGTPYVWGGNKPGGFDCSGLLQYTWAQHGIQIPRTTYDQFKTGTPVAKDQLRPGDAVFFTGSDAKNGLPGHVGMYIGNGKFIEAPHTGATVRISTLAGRSDFVGARRYG